MMINRGWAVDTIQCFEADNWVGELSNVFL
jgi:hypothetical protein